MDFKNLFVFEIANNHQGSLEHGKKIVVQLHRIIKAHGINGVIKFQLRDLQSFIPENCSDQNRFVDRFKSTALEPEDMKKLVDFTKEMGLKTMCTPFDEKSVSFMEELGIDSVKIASCSARDWMLTDCVLKLKKPVLCSTGGLDFTQIDELYDLFRNRNADFAFMHCVSLYPTLEADFNLNCIDQMILRYPDVRIGFSTHEKPDELIPVIIAISKGAQIFEKHVGIADEGMPLNAYSADPELTDRWVRTALHTWKVCGNSEKSTETLEREKQAMYFLKRGVYASKDLEANQNLSGKIYPALRCWMNQMAIEDVTEDTKTDRSYHFNDPVMLGPGQD